MKQKIDEVLKNYDEEMLQTIMKIVNIKSVLENPTEEYPFGENTVKCLEEVLKIARSLGFRTKNVDNYCGYAEVGEGDDIIGILGHLDVVDVEEDKWQTPPFCATIKDGFLYGRGVSDDKGPTLTNLYAVKALMDLGVTFNKRVRIIFGLNEESGMNCVKHYNKVCEPVTLGYTPDGGFPLIQGEKGVYQGEIHYEGNDEVNILSFEGGKFYHSACEEASVTVDKVLDIKVLEEKAKDLAATFEFSSDSSTTTIKAIGKPSSLGDLSTGINAINNIFVLLSEVGVNNTLVTKFNEMIGLSIDANKIGINYKDDFSQTTFNVGMVKVKDNKGYFTFDIRYPVTMKLEEIKTTFDKIVDNYQLQVVPTKQTNSLYFDLNEPLASTLVDTFKDITGDTESKPWIISGGTYARSMKNVVAFGGQFIGEKANVHGNDERTPLENYRIQARIYANAILRLLKI